MRYEARVRAYEAEGLTRSDAQAAAEADERRELLPCGHIDARPEIVGGAPWCRECERLADGADEVREAGAIWRTVDRGGRELRMVCREAGRPVLGYGRADGPDCECLTIEEHLTRCEAGR